MDITLPRGWQQCALGQLDCRKYTRRRRAKEKGATIRLFRFHAPRPAVSTRSVLRGRCENLCGGALLSFDTLTRKQRKRLYTKRRHAAAAANLSLSVVESCLYEAPLVCWTERTPRPVLLRTQLVKLDNRQPD
ncbi:Hypothetical protein SMAX5B_008430 [Scophthalmus maximus]|uniref:Uncharacterized protein n=1 Tax=Scophthalmus maximus TaxID=52904 RepID=A0A2U9B3H2_SCOMX|nr:Hypothetical protein SMAX5B_008430 [Scophthalmus maximus]KAF0030272.1 hypothetical protein F2P81_017003 [Scophthalmus maximus]